VVDDSDYWCEELEELLQDKGFDVVTASDRSTALSVLANESFDIAIIDVNLTDEVYNADGFLINRYIQDNLSDTPVILVSARPLTTQELVDIHPAMFVEKSNMWSQLNLLLEQVMSTTTVLEKGNDQE
jgi:DNA-binding response OmpR family regulator